MQGRHRLGLGWDGLSVAGCSTLWEIPNVPSAVGWGEGLPHLCIGRGPE